MTLPEYQPWSPDYYKVHKPDVHFKRTYIKYRTTKRSGDQIIHGKTKIAYRVCKEAVDFDPGIGRLMWIIPFRLDTPNIKTNYYTKARQNREFHKLFLTTIPKQIDFVDLPCSITLRRISPKNLDFDNLVFAFKFLRDCLADFLIPGLAAGRADGDERFTWIYEQEKREPKEYGIQIEINY